MKIRIVVAVLLIVVGVVLAGIGILRTGFYTSSTSQMAFNVQNQEEFLTGKTTGHYKTGHMILFGVVLIPLGFLIIGKKGMRWLDEE